MRKGCLTLSALPRQPSSARPNARWRSIRKRHFGALQRQSGKNQRQIVIDCAKEGDARRKQVFDDYVACWRTALSQHLQHARSGGDRAGRRRVDGGRISAGRGAGGEAARIFKTLRIRHSSLRGSARVRASSSGAAGAHDGRVGKIVPALENLKWRYWAISLQSGHDLRVCGRTKYPSWRRASSKFQ